MSNTNLPQSGAAHENNSRSIRSGIAQLSDADQKKARLDSSVLVSPPNPAITPVEAIIGCVDTGHSPSGAT